MAKKIVTKSGGLIRVCIDIDSDIDEKLKDYCYADGSNQKEVVLEALVAFLKGKNPPQRPEKVRNKTKVGRPKNNE